MVVGGGLIKDETPVRVSLTISTPKGDVVYKGRVVAHPVKLQPNGPSCPPTAWSAQVFASGTHELQQTNSSG
jgi:hypothetical protein